MSQVFRRIVDNPRQFPRVEDVKVDKEKGLATESEGFALRVGHPCDYGCIPTGDGSTEFPL